MLDFLGIQNDFYNQLSDLKENRSKINLELNLFLHYFAPSFHNGEQHFADMIYTEEARDRLYDPLATNFKY